MTVQNLQNDARVLLNGRVQKYFGTSSPLTEEKTQTGTPNAQLWVWSFYLRGTLIAIGDAATNHSAARASASTRALEWMTNNGYP
jgi:hypothetical protein